MVVAAQAAAVTVATVGVVAIQTSFRYYCDSQSQGILVDRCIDYPIHYLLGISMLASIISDLKTYVEKVA